MAVAPDQGRAIGRARQGRPRIRPPRGTLERARRHRRGRHGHVRFFQRLGFRMLSIDRDASTDATGQAPGLVSVPRRDRIWSDRGIAGPRPRAPAGHRSMLCPRQAGERATHCGGETTMSVYAPSRATEGDGLTARPGKKSGRFAGKTRNPATQGARSSPSPTGPRSRFAPDVASFTVTAPPETTGAAGRKPNAHGCPYRPSHGRITRKGVP